VLLVGILVLGERAQSDLAIVLVAVGVANLVTNFGLPTLLVRTAAREDGRRDRLLGQVIAAYLYLTLVGSVGLAGVLLTLTGSALAALTAGLLLIATSLLSGLEYWALTVDEFERFLGSPARVNATVSLSAPLVLAVSRRPDAALGMLALAGLAPLGTCWGRGAVRQIRTLVHGRGRTGERWLAAATKVGLATAGAAVLYGADVFLIRLSGGIGEDALYRLAVSFVGFAVGLVPAGFFILADAARGQTIRWRGLPILLVFGAGLLTTVAGLIACAIPLPVAAVAAILVWMGPLAAFRVLTQVLGASEHGHGAHGRVALRLWVAALTFILLGGIAAELVGLYGVLAVQTAVELALAISLGALPRSRNRSPSRGSGVGLPSCLRSDDRGAR